MSQTLYRKYRPKNFASVIGQKHIVQTLSNAIKNNRVGHAYLFTGPRGTGKTSIARILAKTVNCENLDGVVTCEKCPSCQMISAGRALDIIEIDAASNTGVENIRELRETVNLQPTALKYKVYIIDEVHMLSTGAFNALLKTLEEPPAHVIFILATTEIHKVPDTIISRCQRFDFARMPIQNIIEKLSLIAKEEKVAIDAESLEMIAIAAEGGMRDAESLLEQIISLEDKNITRKEVEELLGTTDRQFAYDLAEMIINLETSRAIEKVNALLLEGYDLKVFTKTLVNYLRQLMILKVSPELKSYFTYEITGEQLEKMLAQSQKIEMPKIITAIHLFLDAQNKISSFILPQLPLEIAIIKATGNFPVEQPLNLKPEVRAPQPVTPLLTPENSMTTPPPLREIVPPVAESVEEIDPAAINIFDPGVTAIFTVDVQKKWCNFLTEIQEYNHSLRALVSTCQIVSVKGNEITLATPYDFYKEKLNDVQNRLTMETVFGKLLGLKISVKIVTCKEADIAPPKLVTQDLSASCDAQAQQKPVGEQDSLLASALEIMGGTVVES